MITSGSVVAAGTVVLTADAPADQSAVVMQRLQDGAAGSYASSGENPKGRPSLRTHRAADTPPQLPDAEKPGSCRL
jgi:hypothetical protein